MTLSLSYWKPHRGWDVDINEFLSKKLMMEMVKRMSNVVDIYLFVLFFSSILSFILAYHAWVNFVIQHRMTPGKYFTFLLSLVGIWSLGSGIALWSNSEQITYLFEQLKYLGIVFISPAWLLLASSWTGKDKWINWKTISLLLLTPFLSLCIIFTDSIHHLFWSSINFVYFGSFLTTDVVHGPGWWLM